MDNDVRPEFQPYPVRFDAEAPPHFDRPQVVLRVVLFLVLGIFGISLGWIFGALYVLLPAAAAILVSKRGGVGYLAEDGPRVTRLVQWVTSFFAYLAFVGDRFPPDPSPEAPRMHVTVEGQPTVGSALVRLLTSLPSAILLLLLWVIAAIVWLLAAIFVLISEEVPGALYRYERSVVRFTARLLAYHASLVDTYPPFRLGDPRDVPPSRPENIEPPRRAQAT